MTTGFPATRGTDVLLATAAKLPAAPQVLAELNELLLDPHLRLEDVVVVLRRDAALASAMIRIANSSLYAGARVGAVEDAVSRIGLGEVMRVVGLATTTRMAGLALPAYGVPAGAVGRAALLHALAAEAIAPLAGVDTLVAYTGGLLRPLGMMIVDRLQSESGPESPGSLVAGDVFERERSAVGLTSAEATAVVLEAWRFSPELVEATREQYLLRPDVASRLARVLNLAGAVVVAEGAALSHERAWFEANPGKLAALGLKPEDVAVAQTRAVRDYERQQAALA